MKFSTLNNFFSCEQKEIIIDFSKKKVGESVRLFGTLEQRTKGLQQSVTIPLVNVKLVGKVILLGGFPHCLRSYISYGIILQKSRVEKQGLKSCPQHKAISHSRYSQHKSALHVTSNWICQGPVDCVQLFTLFQQSPHTNDSKV